MNYSSNVRKMEPIPSTLTIEDILVYVSKKDKFDGIEDNSMTYQKWADRLMWLSEGLNVIGNDALNLIGESIDGRLLEKFNSRRYEYINEHSNAPLEEYLKLLKGDIVSWNIELLESGLFYFDGSRKSLDKFCSIVECLKVDQIIPVRIIILQWFIKQLPQECQDILKKNPCYNLIQTIKWYDEWLRDKNSGPEHVFPLPKRRKRNRDFQRRGSTDSNESTGRRIIQNPNNYCSSCQKTSHTNRTCPTIPPYYCIVCKVQGHNAKSSNCPITKGQYPGNFCTKCRKPGHNDRICRKHSGNR